MDLWATPAAVALEQLLVRLPSLIQGALSGSFPGEEDVPACRRTGQSYTPTNLMQSPACAR